MDAEDILFRFWLIALTTSEPGCGLLPCRSCVSTRFCWRSVASTLWSWRWCWFDRLCGHQSCLAASVNADASCENCLKHCPWFSKCTSIYSRFFTCLINWFSYWSGSRNIFGLASLVFGILSLTCWC